MLAVSKGAVQDPALTADNPFTTLGQLLQVLQSWAGVDRAIRSKLVYQRIVMMFD